MAGQQRAALRVLVFSLVVFAAHSARAQPREADDPIGGITFDPPRAAIVRHKSGNVMRGDLMAISPEQLQFRLQSGKVFLYELREIRSIATRDRAFRYNSAYDTYRKAVENARGIPGVTIEDVAVAARGGGTPALPTPPPPPTPRLLDSPDNYRAVRIDPSAGPGPVADTGSGLGGGDAAGQANTIPPIPVHQPAGANAGLANAPFYETGAFKIGFLVACLLVILMWWRNRVG